MVSSNTAPNAPAPITPHIAVRSEAYLGEMCYRSCLADEHGPLFLLLNGQKFLPCAQWDGSAHWEPGLSLPREQVQLLREVGRYKDPHQALLASHRYSLRTWGTAADQQWYTRPDHWAAEASILKADVYWPILLELEGEFEQPALIARLRDELQKLHQIERRLICQLNLSLRRSRSSENLILVKRRAVPIDQVRWELEDLLRAIHTRLRSHSLHILVETRDITAQPNVLNLLMSSL
jgi:hypothetical protein